MLSCELLFIEVFKANPFDFVLSESGKTNPSLKHPYLTHEDRLEKHLNTSELRQAMQAKAPQIVQPSVSPDISESASQMESDYSDANVEDIPY